MMQIKEISINDKEYPKRLRYIKNPPEILYVLGNTKILNDEGKSAVIIKKLLLQLLSIYSAGVNAEISGVAIME